MAKPQVSLCIDLQETCLLCKQKLPVYSDQFYVLELCSHRFCVQCLYNYIEKELGQLKVVEEAKAVVNNNNNNEEIKEKAEEIKEEQKEDKVDELEKEMSKKFRMVCPLEDCKSEISISDLKKGLEEFGELSESKQVNTTIRTKQKTKNKRKNKPIRQKKLDVQN